ncbi:MAG: hypothetical protein CM15mP47_4780 [Methanobacteriota archaeon]|nr:MAG: hypothetical protein CM15mP47_4780 [Euryarchaeota archaeon]
MVIAKSPDSDMTGLSHRYLDADKINKSLDKITSSGATYAEVRLVAYTDYSAPKRREIGTSNPGSGNWSHN